MNYRELCREVAALHKGVEIVMVLSADKIIGSYMKSGAPTPEEDEFSQMISQIGVIVRTAKANEDKFGDLEFISIHYKYIDGLFFPLNENETLIAGVVRPYDHDVLASKILTLFARKVEGQ